MDKIMKSQILKLLLIAIFVLMTPLISSSQRTSYLYFIVNLLIISLGADAGLISFFSKSQNNTNTNNLPSVTPQVRFDFSESQNDDKISSPPLSPHTTTTSIKQQKVSPKVVEKCVSEKIVGVTKLVEKDEVKLQKCPSTPSLFFIWSDEDSSEVKEEEEEISGQELFNKAETFIGNFYNQLKMQREESVESLKGVRFASDLKICV